MQNVTNEVVESMSRQEKWSIRAILFCSISEETESETIGYSKLNLFEMRKKWYMS